MIKSRCPVPALTRVTSRRGEAVVALVLCAIVYPAGCATRDDSPGDIASASASADRRNPSVDSPPRPTALTQSTRTSPNSDEKESDSLDSNRIRRTDHSTLADLLLDENADESVFAPPKPHGKNAHFPKIDDAKVQLAGIRIIQGRRLKLYTDLPITDSIKQLPSIVDRAVPRWCDYFEVPPDRAANWRMTGYVIQNKRLFQSLGLLPDDLPPFLHGYQRGRELWIYQQPSDYYLRHLLLHESTHGFMSAMLGGCGPPWYMEGIAEYVATHKWDGNELTLRYFPKSKDEVPYWGRIKIIHDAFEAQQAQMLEQIMQYDDRAHRRIAPYAWSWAATMFLDRHPRYQDSFRHLSKCVRMSEVEFNAQFELLTKNQMRQLDEEWQLFIANMEFGYDLIRSQVEYQSGEPLPPEGATAHVDAARGWQSSGIRLEAGTTYRVEAHGRYRVAGHPERLLSEPGGITIRYYRGAPLGMLLAAIRLDQPQPGLARLAQPVQMGLGKTFTPRQSGTLYFRINDSPAELGDNDGEAEVHVQSR